MTWDVVCFISSFLTEQRDEVGLSAPDLSVFYQITDYKIK